MTINTRSELVRMSDSRLLAVVILAITGVTLTGCSLLGDLGHASITNQNSTAAGTDTGVFEIGVGDCLNDGGAEGTVTSVKVIDCAEPHDSEAFTSILMADGEFPGQDSVSEQGTTGCTAAFTAFVGTTYDTSGLDFSFFYPTEESWSTGDREILCLILDPNGKTIGSLAGAAR